MTPERAEQIADTIALLRGMLGDRDATKVHVEVTRRETTHDGKG